MHFPKTYSLKFKELRLEYTFYKRFPVEKFRLEIVEIPVESEKLSFHRVPDWEGAEKVREISNKNIKIIMGNPTIRS